MGPPRRYVLTGPPGAGKTAILRGLHAIGHCVVEESVTDLITEEQAAGCDEPWRADGFIDRIVRLQRDRQCAPAAEDVAVQIYDRSPLCTMALARYQGLEVPALLSGEVERVTRAGVYESTVFFVDSLGSIRNTAVRRINYRDSLRFGAIHRAVYSEYGYQLVTVRRGSVRERAAFVDSQVSALLSTEPPQ